jgi:parallel beta-helix repeat protein
MSAKLRPYAGPATLVSLAMVLTFAVVALAALSGAEAAGQGQPRCGDTITSDKTLHEDVLNCPNNGIVIGANGITLDLNGHTIDGDGTPAAGCDPNAEVCDTGVVNDGHDGVTVMHGRVGEFGVGVLFGTSTAGKVRHNSIIGVSSTRNQFVGIGIFSSVRSLVRDSSGSDSIGSDDAAGMGLADSHHVRIVHNSFRGNAHFAVLIGGGSTDNLIKRNFFSRNGDEAILMEGGEGFQVRRNRFLRNGGGITLGPGSHNVITGNHVERGRDGIRIEKGDGNLVADNVVVDTRRVGIRLGIKRPFIGGAHNVVRRNLVRDSRVDGFVVVKKDHHSLLKHNVATGSGDDGFDIESSSATLTSNRALRNADLGIEAVRGVIDGGGNIARHNGDPRECTNIVCG